MKICTYPGCGRKRIAKGYCSGHYDAQRLGYPMDRANLTPEGRFWRNVEKTDTHWLWTGLKCRAGYGRMSNGPRKVQAHRFSYELHVGPIPDGMVVDHKCHTPACVNPDHLQVSTVRGNAENREGANPNNTTSGVRGVTRRPNGKWQAYFYRDGKRFNVGTFASVAEAEAAVIAARLEAMTNSDLELRNRSEVPA